MRLERMDGPGEITFFVTGSLTGLNDSAIKLFENISLEIDRTGKAVVIDLKQNTFTDSIAVGLIIGVMLKADGLGKSVRMIHVPPHVEEVFKTINLKKAFPNAY